MNQDSTLREPKITASEMMARTEAVAPRAKMLLEDGLARILASTRDLTEQLAEAQQKNAQLHRVVEAQNAREVRVIKFETALRNSAADVAAAVEVIRESMKDARTALSLLAIKTKESKRRKNVYVQEIKQYFNCLEDRLIHLSDTMSTRVHMTLAKERPLQGSEAAHREFKRAIAGKAVEGTDGQQAQA